MRRQGLCCISFPFYIKPQQRISALESQNEEFVRHIETMEREHREERTKFNEYMDKIQRYFPHVEKLLPLIDFCRNTLKFSERVIQELCKLKKVRLKGNKTLSLLFFSPNKERLPILWESHIFKVEQTAIGFE